MKKDSTKLIKQKNKIIQKRCTQIDSLKILIISILINPGETHQEKREKAEMTNTKKGKEGITLYPIDIKNTNRIL